MEWFSIAKHGVGFDVTLILACLFTVIFIQYRSRTRLLNLIHEATTAIFLLEKDSGLVMDANQMAIQLLGIRRVGKRYFLPPLITPESLLMMIESAKKEPCQTWMVSELNCRQVNLSLESYDCS